MKFRLLFALACCFLAMHTQAQETLTFQNPPPEIAVLADYERAPSVNLDTKKEYMLLSYRNTYKSLDDLNQEELRLGGLRINPVTNISSTVTYINNLKVRKISESAERQVQGLPENPRIANLSLSPDEKKYAFTHTVANGLELWVLDVATATATKLTEAVLNGTMGSPFNWYSDSEQLLVRFLPKNRPKLIDVQKSLPNGPTVSVSEGTKSQNRTFQDLLKNKTDEKNFETVVSAELHTVSLKGQVSFFKSADLYTGISFSPDGNYLLITTLKQPFSYIVPFYRFPQITTVYNKTGREIKVVNDVPLNEVMPKGFSSVRQGKRDMGWRSDMPASLYYAEALDGGDQSVKADYRDELFVWDLPFTEAPVSLMKTVSRFGGVTWGDAEHALVSDSWYDTRNAKTYLVNPSKLGAAPKVIFDLNTEDIYADPGTFETKKNKFNRYTLAMENERAFLIGDGFTAAGQFPFVDALDLKTLKTQRLYQSTFTDKKEDLLSIEDLGKGEILVRIQSKNEYPNYYFRNIKKGGKLEQITFFKNPFESIANVHKEVIKYPRKDGVELTGTLYLPVGYDPAKKEKYPLLIWAYPNEYKDKSSAGQNNKNPNEFTFPYYGTFIYWVTRGYVVLDDASFPIIGEGKTEPNDNFIEQLVWNAEAAIDAVDKLGYIDRKRCAIGGHSYGAFMTANLLTHSNLFACGIARSGAYNRTLTPFGFQSEQRNYWDVPDLYNQMSPFMQADKMKTPLLLVHGDADNNPGTFTLQTERYFQALKGLGAPVRMVLLPKEAHGYVAKENIFHLLWEQDTFLEKYLKK